MPKAHCGAKCPAEMIGNAVAVRRVAKRRLVADAPPRSSVAELGRHDGWARADGVTPERRAEIAGAAAAKRWEQPRRAATA